MRIDFWRTVARVAHLYKGGHGAKGPDIFRRLRRNRRQDSGEIVQAMTEYGFTAGKTPKGDYWVSSDSDFFPKPMKREKPKNT